MWWQQLLTAFALILIVEGIWPFINPSAFRKRILSLTLMNDQSLRIGGGIMMLIGVALSFFIQ